jgi:AcrR family transcriptional regulator
MTIVAPTSTGSSLGDFDEFAAYESEAVSKHTPAIPVDNPNLTFVLRRFARTQPRPLAAMEAFWGLRAGVADSEVSRVVNTATLQDVREAFERIAELNWAAGDRTATDAAPASDEPAYPKPITSVFVSGSMRMLTLVFGSVDGPIDIDIVAPWLGSASYVHDQLVDKDEDEGNTEEVVDERDDAVMVIDQLVSNFGMAKRDILKAAGVSRSSFYSWRGRDGHKPRVASQGRLWELAQVAADLADVLAQPIQPWLLAEPRRRKMLLAGCFDELLRDAVGYRSRRAALGDDIEANWIYAVGGDRDDPARMDTSDDIQTIDHKADVASAERLVRTVRPARILGPKDRRAR